MLDAAYDITPEKGFVARWVNSTGKTNVYLAYRQRVRAGMDVYFIFGDPNADRTQNTVLLKLIRPL